MKENDPSTMSRFNTSSFFGIARYALDSSALDEIRAQTQCNIKARVRSHEKFETILVSPLI